MDPDPTSILINCLASPNIAAEGLKNLTISQWEVTNDGSYDTDMFSQMLSKVVLLETFMVIGNTNLAANAWSSLSLFS